MELTQQPTQTDPIKDQLSQLKYDDKTKAILRSKGVNVTKLESNLSNAINKASGAQDISLAEPEANEWAKNMDLALGKKYYTNRIGTLFSPELRKDTVIQQQQLVDETPSTGPELKDIAAFGKAFANSFIVDTVVGGKTLGRLGLSKAAGLIGIDLNEWADKGSRADIAEGESIKFKLDDVYNTKFISFDGDSADKNSFGFKLGTWKSAVGTIGQLAGFVAPMFGGAFIAKASTAVPRAVAMASPELLVNSAIKAGNITKGIGFTHELATTYGQVLKEGLNNGLEYNDAWKVSLPVAIATAGISQLGTHNFVKMFGMTEATARRTASHISNEVMAEQLGKLAGRSLTAGDFLSVAERVSVETGKRMANPAYVNTIKNGILGIAKAGVIEGFEEFSQKGVELIAKETFNRIADSQKNKGGRFEDLTFQQGLKAALEEGAVGALFGGFYGWKGQNTKVDESIYGTIRSSIQKTKSALGENFSPDKVVFEADKQIDQLYANKKISQSEYERAKTKVKLMKQVAFDFEGSDATMQEQNYMFKVAEARYNVSKKEQVLQQALEFVNNIESNTELSQERKMYEWSKAINVLGQEVQQADGSASYENLIKLGEERQNLDNVIKSGISGRVNKDNAISVQNSRIAELDNHNKAFSNESLDFSPEVIVNYNGVDYLVDTGTHNEPLVRPFSRKKVKDGSLFNISGVSTYNPSQYDSSYGDNVTDKSLIAKIVEKADIDGGINFSEDSDVILSAKSDLIEAKEFTKNEIAQIDQSLDKEVQKEQEGKIINAFKEKYSAISDYIKSVDPFYRYIGEFDEISGDLGLKSNSQASKAIDSEDLNNLNTVYQSRATKARESFELRSKGLAGIELDLAQKGYQSEFNSIVDQYEKEHKRITKKAKIKDAQPISLEDYVQAQFPAQAQQQNEAIGGDPLAPTAFDGEAEVTSQKEVDAEIEQEAINSSVIDEPLQDNRVKASELIGNRVIFNGEVGFVKQDEGGKVTVESEGKIYEITEDTYLEEFLPESISFFEGSIYIGENKYKYVSSNSGKGGDTVSITLEKEDGKQITIRQSDLVQAINSLKLDNDVNNIEFNEDEIIEAKAIIQTEIESQIPNSASVLLESFPSNLDGLLSSMRGDNTSINATDIEDMAIRAIDWIYEVKGKLEKINSPKKELKQVEKALSDFENKINKHYEKVRKQRLAKDSVSAKNKSNKSTIKNKGVEKITNNENTQNNETTTADNTRQIDPEEQLRLQQSVQDLAGSDQQLISEVVGLEQESPSVELIDRIQGSLEQSGGIIDETEQQAGINATEQSVNQDSNTDRVGQNQEAKPDTNLDKEQSKLLDELASWATNNFPRINFQFTDSKAFQERLADLYPAKSKGQIYAYIDPNSGEVFLDKDNLDMNVLMHEMGHLWAFYAKSTNPEMYKRGIELIQNTVYQTKAKLANPELSGEALDNEALANAIENKGVEFVNKTRQNTFKDWINNLMFKVAQYLHVNKNVAIGDLTLDQFTTMALNDIFRKSKSIQQSEISKIAQEIGFSNPVAYTKATRYNIADLKQLRDDIFNSEVNTQNSIFDPKDFYVTQENKNNFNKKLRLETGYILTSVSSKGVPSYSFQADAKENDINPYYWMLSEDSVNGFSYSRVYTSDLSNDILSKVTGTIKNINGFFKGRVGSVRVSDNIIPWMERLTPDNVFEILRDENGFVDGFLDNIKRNGIMRRHKLLSVLHDKLGRLADVLVDYDSGKINTFENAPKEKISVYTKDGSGFEDIEIPKDWLLSISRTHKTMMETFGESAVISETGARRKNQVADQYTKSPFGLVMYKDFGHPDKSVRYEILMTEDEMSRIEDIISNDATLSEANSILTEIYQDPSVNQLLKEVHDSVKLDTELNIENEYEPLLSYATFSQKKESKTGDRAIEESRILNKRGSKPADAYVVRPPLVVANGHVQNEADIVENEILAQNLAQINTAFREAYKKPEFKELGDRMKGLFEEANGTNRIENTDAAKGWEKLNMRLHTLFVKSAFTVNPGVALKQLWTPISSTDVRDKDGRRLIDMGSMTSSLGTLIKLGIWDNYTSNLGVASNNQYAGTIKPYLDEMVSYGTLQPTVGRILGDSINGIYGLTSINASKSGGIVAKAQNTAKYVSDNVSNYGLSFMKKADTAGIITIFEAAKKQAYKNGFTPGTDTFKKEVGRITNDVVLKSNQTGDTMESTALQKEGHPIIKAISLFSGQQQKQFNLVLNNAIKSAKDPDNAQKKAAYHKSIANSIIGSAIYVASAGIMWSAFYKWVTGDEPDDVKKVGKNFGLNVVSSIIGSMPGGITAISDEVMRDLTMDFTKESGLATPQSIITLMKTEDVLVESIKIAMDDKKDISNDYMYKLFEDTSRLTGLPQRIMQTVRKKYFKVDDKRKSTNKEAVDILNEEATIDEEIVTEDIVIEE